MSIETLLEGIHRNTKASAMAAQRANDATKNFGPLAITLQSVSQICTKIIPNFIWSLKNKQDMTA